MRKIVYDTEDSQVQQDDTGYDYFYRKDYLFRGDMNTEYSLALVYARKGEKSRGFFIMPEKVCETTGPVLPVQSG